jgi:hypothetical protein
MGSDAKSVPSLLRILWEEGFFAEAKDLSEISGGLAAKGYHLQDSSLGVALTDLSQGA